MAHPLVQATLGETVDDVNRKRFRADIWKVKDLRRYCELRVAEKVADVLKLQESRVTMVATARRGGGVGETQQGEEDLETTTAHLFDSYAGQDAQNITEKTRESRIENNKKTNRAKSQTCSLASQQTSRVKGLLLAALRTQCCSKRPARSATAAKSSCNG